MGLISELDYEVKDANAIQRVTQKVAASGPGAWVFQRTMYPIDKGLYRLTKGRLTVPGLMAGLPVIMMTTTGAKTGKDRTMPLVGIPMGDDLAVMGSNFGQSSTPGWVYNLRAKPEATVEFGSINLEEQLVRSIELAPRERSTSSGELGPNRVRWVEPGDLVGRTAFPERAGQRESDACRARNCCNDDRHDPLPVASAFRRQ